MLLTFTFVTRGTFLTLDILNFSSFTMPRLHLSNNLMLIFLGFSFFPPLLKRKKKLNLLCTKLARHLLNFLNGALVSQQDKLARVYAYTVLWVNIGTKFTIHRTFTNLVQQYRYCLVGIYRFTTRLKKILLRQLTARKFWKKNVIKSATKILQPLWPQRTSFMWAFQTHFSITKLPQNSLITAL